MDYDKLLYAMSNPAFYPHRPEGVQVLQTHISYLFLAGAYVYKIKKAVDFGFLDFTSLKKRKFYCDEELRLNRRLAPDVYLDVAEISEGREGNLLLAPGKNTVEYAVRMRRLPADRMLKALLATEGVAPSVLESLAGKVADFHRHAATGGKIDLMGSAEVIRRNQDENFAQMERHVGATIRDGEYRFIKSSVYEFLEREQELLAGRVDAHRIRECHGDLHLEHICLTDEIVIFDCIEFNERFRYTDVAAEVAFLAMDLDYNGYPEHTRTFVDAYIRTAGDPDISRLLNFYQCYYACVRGKVNSFRTHDATLQPGEREKARETAIRYFDLAYAYAARSERPVLILTIGLMGTGKSALARNLASPVGAAIIRTDRLRKEMLHIPAAKRHYEDFGEGIYGEDVSRQTYAEALRQARETIARGVSVIIDASYKRQAERIRAYEAAKQMGVDFFIIECTCREEIVKKRLDARAASHGGVSDGRWEIYHAQKNDFDPLVGFPPGVHLLVDTSTKAKTDTHEVIVHLQKWGRKR